MVKNFFAVEYIEGWTCNNCTHSDPNCIKRMKIEKLPQLYLVQICRFQLEGDNLIKDTKPIVFTEYLHAFEKRENINIDIKHAHTYRLIGTINHMGLSMENGHYIAYCKSKDR